MLYAIVVLLILIADQAVKYWTSQTLPLNGAPRDFIFVDEDELVDVFPGSGAVSYAAAVLF